MKRSFFSIVAFLLMGMTLLVLSNCTHEDQIIDEYIPPIVGPQFSATELLSQKVDAGPSIDGNIDQLWEESQKLVTRAVVPDPGDDFFAGYVGNAYPVTIRSAYTDQDIFFLVEWDDPNQDFNRQTWYFNPADKSWKQENRFPTFNENGAMVRQAFYEDKFAFLWNVNNSVPAWDQSTCYTSCHTGLSEADGISRHYTNNPGERIDMWHWKSVRTGPNNQLDDQFQDEAQPNGRHSDAKISGGYTNNIQDLIVAATGDTVTVPKYFIPAENYYYWITQDQIDNQTAKLITAVDENGILTYDGGSIDPNTDTDFQRDGDIVGSKGIPSIYTATIEGSRGDLSGKAVYTGSGWILEIQRKLQTGDTEDQDIDFSDLTDQAFGIGVFDNAALAHAIKPNLVLKFDNN